MLKKALPIWLLQTALVSASIIPDATQEKRASPTDLIDELTSDLLAKFESSIPVPADNATDLLSQLLSILEGGSYTLPTDSEHPILRAANIETVRALFAYGDPVGGGPSYPSGLLGIAKDAVDVVNIQLDLTPQLVLAIEDSKNAILDATKYNGLQTLDDYAKLYEGEWTNSLPKGPDLGVLTNYTQDLFFSMQRLSNSPYQIRRLLNSTGELPFTIDNSTVNKISGVSLEQLFAEGRLFYADYRDQATLESTGRYAAACDAYFYIDPSSGDFLPLAIRTNVGSNLIYTPLDSQNDWMLAKMMFNVNDFWFTQWNHLAATHEVVQIVWMAAIRSLSQEHPVYAILNRLTYQAFSIQILAKGILFSTGGAVDLIFSYTGAEAENYTTTRYNGGAGRFKANYFKTDLKSRGLINSCHGPRIKSFPFYEDALVIYNAIHGFMTDFVQSYYSSDADVAADKEIQAWVAECNGDAEVIDFPAEISSMDTLIDVLTHVAHLVSSAHHAVNTNELLQVSSTLPFSPPSLYSAPPTAKSMNTSLVEFLPPLEKVVEQFLVGSLFARPLLSGTNRSIIHMFDDQSMLSLMNEKTQTANSVFVETMQAFSAQVSNRTFDENGLSQGMPFVWTALDPNVAPYSLVV